jgi:predicted metal-dependent enzyme (double-stranded beta helix superfamily)
MQMTTRPGEFFVQHPALHTFIAAAHETIARAATPEEALAALRQPFAVLLAERTWLPRTFREPCASGGMGGGIGQWLIYRAADESLTLFSLVVPPGVSTPVHDHLAWGLVGLYEGQQEERVYRQVRSLGEGHAELELAEVRQIDVGDFYELLPPHNDIHSVRTTSPTPSVSLHLLGRDVGCIWRHAYEPERATVRAFRSGYTNAACPDERAAAPSA